MADWTGKRNGPDYTVDIPRKKLSIADLAQANAGVPRRDSADPGQGGDPLAEAKAFLARPSVLDRAPSPETVADTDARLAWNSQNNAMGADIAQRRKGLLRRGTEGLSGAGDVASAGSLATLPLAMAGLPEVSGALMGLGGLLHVPDQLRRAYAPQGNETQPGLGEAAMTGLELLPGMGLGKEAAMGADVAGNGAADLRKTFGVRQASEMPYRMGGSVQPAEAVARPAGDWLDQTLSTGRGTGLTQDILNRGAKAGLPTTENAWKSLGDLNRRPEGFTNSSQSVKDLVDGGNPRLVDVQRPYQAPEFSFEGSGPELADLPTSSIDSPGWNTISGGPAAPVEPFPTSALPKGGSTKARADIIKARNSMWDRSNFRPKGQ